MPVLSAGMFLALGLSGQAWAACDPAATSNITATCTGTTNNQNGSNGYGTSLETGITVDVEPEASVTGADYGIGIASGTVVNLGAISGGQYGIYATGGALDVTNSGMISGYGGVGGQSLILSNSGTIQGTEFGVQGYAGDAAVTNSGTISGNHAVRGQSVHLDNSGAVEGTADGVFAFGGVADVTNSGAISGGHAIEGQTVELENSGTITGGEFGVQAYSGSAEVTNSGTISATKALRGSSVYLDNSGTISSTAEAVFAYSGDATVTNSGSISGSYGVQGQRVYLDNSGSIIGDQRGVAAYAGSVEMTNSGTIRGGEYGVFANSGSSAVTNSGTIEGGVGALYLGGPDSTLTLLPGSRLIGSAYLGAGSAVDVEAGNQNLTFASPGTLTFSSSLPYAVSGKQVATVDPTSFGLTDRTLMDFSGFVAGVLDSRSTVGGAGARLAAPALAYLPTDKADVAGLSAVYADAPGMGAAAQYAGGLNVWGQGFGGRRWQQAGSGLQDATIDYYGGLFGADAAVAPSLRVGLFFGGGATDTDRDLGDDSSDLAFAGLYADKAFGATFLRGALQGGYTWNDTERRINNNLAPGGLETAKGSYEGWYVSPEATLGHVFALPGRASRFALTPSVKVRWLHAELDGYTESGSTANLTVADRSLDRFEERAELKASASDIALLGLTLGAEAHGGVLGQQRVGDDTVDTTLLGQGLSFSTPGDDNVWGGYGGAGLSLGWGRATFGVTAEATFYSDDSQALAVHGGATIAF